ncbi:Titin [Orchesella cincta]|uniref:Titin n=1 Tax=Orchesella cincta TaxID=48709 RepID=A0A1D2NG87_ORCCI|nr:Titin [Orchesella cincta]
MLAVEIQEVIEEVEERPLKTASLHEGQVEFEEQSLEIREVQPEESVKEIKPTERRVSVGRQTITESKSVEISEVQEVEVGGELKQPRRASKSKASVAVSPQKSVEISEVQPNVSTGEMSDFTTQPQSADSKLVTSESRTTQVVQVHESTGEFSGKFKPTASGRGQSPNARSRRASEKFEQNVFKTAEESVVKVDQAPEEEITVKPKRKVQTPKPEDEDDVNEVVTLKPKKKVEKPKDDVEAGFTIPKPQEPEDVEGSSRSSEEEGEDVEETVTLKPKKKVEAPKDEEFSEELTIKQERKKSVEVVEETEEFTLRPKSTRIETLEDAEFTLKQEAVSMGEDTVSSDITIKKRIPFKTQDLPTESVTLKQLDQTFEDIEGDYKIKLPGRKQSVQASFEDESVELTLTDAVLPLRRPRAAAPTRLRRPSSQIKSNSYQSEEIDQDLSVKLKSQRQAYQTGLEPVTQVEIGESLELVVVIKKTNIKYEHHWFKDGKEVTQNTLVEDTSTHVRYIRRVSKTTLDESGVHTLVIGSGTSIVSQETKVVVKRKCSFSEKLTDMEVVENETALFTVILSEESSEVTWHKDGEPLKQSERIKFIKDEKLRQLVIKSVSVHDEGEYTVVILDNEKECSAEMNVVELPPELKKKLQDTEVPRGDRAYFDIELTKGDALCTEDQGVYACRIGVEEQYSGQGTLTVTEPTVYFKRKLPEFTSAEEERDIELTVEVSDETCAVTWIRNNSITVKSADRYKLVKKGTKRILRISKINKSEDHEFKCVIQSTTSETRTQIQFTTVQVSPKVLNRGELSSLIQVKQHENLDIRVEFSPGNPTAETKWIVQDSQLDFKINERDDGVSEISVYSVQNDSNLEFRAWNSCGEDKVNVAINVSPPSRPGRPQCLDKSDNSISLSWSAPESDGRDAIRNYILESRRSDSSSWSVVNSDFNIEETVFNVYGVEKSSQYVYRVTAENGVGRSPPSEESEVFTIQKSASSKLEFVEELQDVVIGGGLALRQVRGSCTFENRVAKCTLTIDEDSEASYTCVVSNKQSKISSKCRVSCRERVTLTVEEHESVEEISESSYKTRVSLGGEMNLRIRYSGYPAPDIRITRNQQEYEHAVVERKSVVIRKTVEKSDAGNYVIIARNEFSEQSVKISVTVIDESVKKPERPGPPEGPFAVLPNDREELNETLKLEWNPPLQDGGAEISKYSIEQKVQGSWSKVADVNSSMTSYCVQSVQKGFEYMFRVTAENAVGRSDPLLSVPVEIDSLKKLRLPPPLPPFDISGMTSTSFTLRWTESKKPYDVVGYLVEKREAGKKAWQKCATTETNMLDITGLKTNVSYHFRICSLSAANDCSEFVLIQDEAITIGKRITPPSPPQNLMVVAVTSRSVTIQWSPPKSTGGGELTGYIIEKKLEESSTWEKVVTLETSVTQYQISNLREKSVYVFRVFAENGVGVSQPCVSNKVVLKTHATPPSPPTAPLESRQIGVSTMIIEWGIPESDGGAPIEGYVIAIRDSKKTMWMEVGQVGADIQKLTVRELQDGHEYMLRIFARNEIGLSEALESDELIKICNAKLDPSALAEARGGLAQDDEVTTEKETPSLSLTTETHSSWMREAGMDADIRFYSRSALLRRNEYFFRIWHYAKELFK